MRWYGYADISSSVINRFLKSDVTPQLFIFRNILYWNITCQKKTNKHF